MVAIRQSEAVGPIVDTLVRIGNAVPDSVELGYHLCYGDAAHKHFSERDTAKMADVARGVAHGLARRLTWVHVPVPRDRSDPAFLEPTRGADLDAETTLYLGLVHRGDGLPGGRARIATAADVLQRECGLGRELPGERPRNAAAARRPGRAGGGRSPLSDAWHHPRYMVMKESAGIDSSRKKFLHVETSQVFERRVAPSVAPVAGNSTALEPYSQ